MALKGQHGLDIIESLADKIITSARTSHSTHSTYLKEFLSISLECLPLDGRLPSDPMELKIFRLVQQCLYKLSEYSSHIPHDGIIWQGKPSFLCDDMLGQLSKEMNDIIGTSFPQRNGQHVSYPGVNTGSDILIDGFMQLIVDNTEPAIALMPSIPSCLHYTREGDCIAPHVDTEYYDINANLLVSHDYTASKTSSIVIYPITGEPVTVELFPGEAVIFYAGSIIHCRTPVSQGELVQAVSYGYKYQLPKEELRC